MTHPMVILYALSTCVHCRHMQEFLENNNIAFECTHVDKLDGDARKSVLEKVREVNPRLSFPTMIVEPSRVVIVGYNPEALMEALSA